MYVTSNTWQCVESCADLNELLLKPSRCAISARLITKSSCCPLFASIFVTHQQQLWLMLIDKKRFQVFILFFLNDAVHIFLIGHCTIFFGALACLFVCLLSCQFTGLPRIANNNKNKHARDQTQARRVLQHRGHSKCTFVDI